VPLFDHSIRSIVEQTLHFPAIDIRKDRHTRFVSDTYHKNRG
jgi:hypothetical protein